MAIGHFMDKNLMRKLFRFKKKKQKTKWGCG